MLGAIGEGFGGTVMGIMGGPAWQALVADKFHQIAGAG